jgi:hypothetical protein
MRPISTLCGQTAELLITKASGTYGYHLALKGWDDETAISNNIPKHMNFITEM